MKEIPVKHGYVALVDDDMFDELMQYNWYPLRTKSDQIYVQGKLKGKQNPPVRMHRLVMRAVKGTSIDHRNRNAFDNQRHNLRFCTSLQNSQNQPPRKTRFKGVYQDKKTGLWNARIMLNKKHVHLGSFEYEDYAAVAYDRVALDAFGEFAWLNVRPHDPKPESYLLGIS